MVATLPSGGKGISPPGTVPPENFYSYSIDYIYALYKCSETLPKPINDLTNLYDTIYISEAGLPDDLNVEIDITHTYCGDVEIYLIAPNGTEIDLCVGHGGSGNNFIGTIFDDEADTTISEGSAPFTGSYIPDEPLATFMNLSSIQGNWVLRIYDNALNDNGQLNNWCLDFQYRIGTENLVEPENSVYQNFPNPFTGQTTFSFKLESSSDVRIDVYDLLGREIETVIDRTCGPGLHEIKWNAGTLSPGQYIYKVKTGDKVEVKSMMIAN